MKIILNLLLVIAAASDAIGNKQRILGGVSTAINAFPELASLLFSATSVDHRQACGGMILNNRFILTAAHCTHGHAASMWRMRLGSTFSNSGGLVFNVNRITNHPNFNPGTMDSDVGVMRASSNIVLSYNMRAGAVAGTNYNVADDVQVRVVGWGVTEVEGEPADRMHHVHVRTVNQTVCAQNYATFGRSVTDNMLCAGLLDVGACKGDEGGPLFHNFVAIGIISWANGCGQAEYPHVYTRVNRFTDWIVENAI